MKWRSFAACHGCMAVCVCPVACMADNVDSYLDFRQATAISAKKINYFASCFVGVESLESNTSLKSVPWAVDIEDEKMDVMRALNVYQLQFLVLTLKNYTHHIFRLPP